MKKTTKWVLGGGLSLCLLVSLYFFLSQEPTFNSWQGGGGVEYCTSYVGYYCKFVEYSGATGNLTVVFGQNTWQTWTGWAVGYASNMTASAPTDMSSIIFSPVPGVIQLSSGQEVTVSGNILPASKSNTKLGTLTSGNIWVCYTTASGVTGMSGGKGTCTPTGNVNAEVKYIRIVALRGMAS